MLARFGGIALIGTIGACLLAILLHECFHALSARCFRTALYFVRPSAIGLKARLKDRPKSFKKLTAIYISGPVGNFLLAALFFGREGFWGDLFEANLAIGLFNLLPIHPLDGGQIFLIVAYKLMGSNRAFKVLKRMTVALKIALYLLGLLQLILFTNPSLLVAAILLPGTRLLEETMSIMKLENLINRKQRIMRKKIFSARHLVILDDSSLGDIIQRLDYDRFHILYVLNKDMEIIGQITEQQVIKALQTCNATDRVCDIFFLD